MSRPLVHLVYGTRTSLALLAALWRELGTSEWCTAVLVRIRRVEIDVPEAAWMLRLKVPNPAELVMVSTGTAGEEAAAVMRGYEALASVTRPAAVVVAGGDRDAMAVTIAAKKLCLPVCHAEAGRRGGDRFTPGEIDRAVTDALADLLWASSPVCERNMTAEGIPAERIEVVGSLMSATIAGLFHTPVADSGREAALDLLGADVPLDDWLVDCDGAAGRRAAESLRRKLAVWR